MMEPNKIYLLAFDVHLPDKEKLPTFLPILCSEETFTNNINARITVEIIRTHKFKSNASKQNIVKTIKLKKIHNFKDLINSLKSLNSNLGPLNKTKLSIIQLNNRLSRIYVK